MKPGTQADLIRHLKSEYEIDVSRNAISLLVKSADYRIVKTPGGKIKIEETGKALVDSGFGKRAGKKLNGKGTKPKKAPTEKEQTEDTKKAGPLKIEDTRERIERHKLFHQSEKERIANEEKLQNLIPRGEIGESAFEFFRPLRDDLQAMSSKVSTSLVGLTQHQIERKITDEAHRILASVVKEYQGDSASVKKNLTVALLDTLSRH